MAGRGHELFAGSLANGAIYRANARTGEGEVLVPGETGRVAVGLAFDPRTGYVFAAGGPTGMAHVFDSRTGEEVASYTLTAPGTFINDVVVTKDGAYFTDSGQASLFVLPLSPDGGLPASPQALPLTGEWVQIAGEFNANGIEATQNGKTLIVVNSEVGTLYAVDPENGEATAIDLGGGLRHLGRRIAAAWQDPLRRPQLPEHDRRRRSWRRTWPPVPWWTSSSIQDFRVPTTIASLGHRLYVVNARFDVQPPTPDTEYEIVRVDGH